MKKKTDMPGSKERCGFYLAKEHPKCLPMIVPTVFGWKTSQYGGIFRKQQGYSPKDTYIFPLMGEGSQILGKGAKHGAIGVSKIPSLNWERFGAISRFRSAHLSFNFLVLMNLCTILLSQRLTFKHFWGLLWFARKNIEDLHTRKDGLCYNSNSFKIPG